VTKKEIVKQISDKIGLTQLKTKDIVQQTFDAIVKLNNGKLEKQGIQGPANVLMFLLNML